MKKIGSLTPTITDPESMAEQCQFQLLFSHGSTMMNSLMIVPKDTFLLFLGPSGYYNYPSKINKSLVLTNMFPTIDAYYKNMYENFFSKENARAERPSYPYPSSQIYTPGDIIHDINLSFYSNNSQSVVFFYGYHTLPFTETPLEANGSIADPLTNYTGFLNTTYYVSFVLFSVSKGKIDETLLNTFEVKPEVKDEFDKLITLSTYNEIDTALKRVKLTTKNNVYKLDTWFNNPDSVMYHVIFPYEQSYPNNQYKFKSKFKSDLRNTLSKVLQEYPNTEIGSPKQYRLIMIQACRGPDVNLGTFHDPEYYNWNAYRNLPPRQLTLASGPQKLARRMSFSAKQPLEVCPLGIGAPPMNLISVKKAMEDIAPFVKEYDEKRYPKEHKFLRLIYETFFKVKKTTKVKILKTGELLSYNEHVDTTTFLQAIDKSVQTFPLLMSTNPVDTERNQRFQNVVQTFQNMIRIYAMTAALNDPFEPSHTIGEHIYKQIQNHTAKPVLKYTQEEKENMIKGVQTKLLQLNQDINPIRPMIEQLIYLYKTLNEIKKQMIEIEKKYNQVKKKHFMDISQSSSNILNQSFQQTKNELDKLYNIDSLPLMDKFKQLQSILTSDYYRIHFPGMFTESIRKFDSSFGGNNAYLQSFQVFNLYSFIESLSKDINHKYGFLIQNINKDNNEYNNIKKNNFIDVINQKNKQIEEIVKTINILHKREQELKEKLNNLSITNIEYNTNMEDLSKLIQEYIDYNVFIKDTLRPKIQKEMMEYIDDIQYKNMINKPILSYHPKFLSIYSNDKNLTFSMYKDIIDNKLNGYEILLQQTLITLEYFKKNYQSKYKLQRENALRKQQQARNTIRRQTNQIQRNKNRGLLVRGASGAPTGSTRKPNQTSKNRPMVSSMVSGETGKPNGSITQINQTRKKPWWEKRREKQAAKRNQTMRNGKNVLSSVPTL